MGGKKWSSITFGRKRDRIFIHDVKQNGHEEGWQDSRLSVHNFQYIDNLSSRRKSCSCITHSRQEHSMILQRRSWHIPGVLSWVTQCLLYMQLLFSWQDSKAKLCNKNRTRKESGRVDCLLRVVQRDFLLRILMLKPNSTFLVSLSKYRQCLVIECQDREIKSFNHRVCVRERGDQLRKNGHSFLMWENFN